TKIVIEGEDAVHFGARQSERFGDHRDRRLRHVAERFLQRVQDHQRRAFDALMLRDDLRGALSVPWFVSRLPCSRSEGYCWYAMRLGIDLNINKAVSCCDREWRSIRLDYQAIWNQNDRKMVRFRRAKETY